MTLQGQLRHMNYIAKVPQFRVYVHVRVRDHSHVCVLSVCVSVSMSVSDTVPYPFLFPYPFPCLFEFKYTAMNIYGDMAIILSIPKGPFWWRGSLKGLSYEKDG
jgi:hypothetical protein